MPTLMSTAEVTAFAHCPRPMCPGGEQEPVEAIREEVGVTYMESGGDSPFIEKSHVQLRFKDEAQHDCPECGHKRELTNQPRVDYPSLSGHDPSGLLGIKYGAQTRDAPHV